MGDILTTALGGLNVQQQRLARAADNIANATTPGRSVDLASEAVEVLTAKSLYKANLAVVKVSEEMDKSLLDIIA